jgi:hypothetical protein
LHSISRKARAQDPPLREANQAHRNRERVFFDGLHGLAIEISCF